MTEPHVDAEQVTYCARHRTTETVLRCGRCDTPICPQCMVMTPVGARCPECGHGRRIHVPMYSLTPLQYTLSTAAALAVGLGIGVGWWWIIPEGLGLFFAVVLGLGFGWVMFRAIEFASQGKRGAPLQVLAGLGLVIAYLLRNTLLDAGPIPSGDLTGITVTAVAILVAVSQLR